MYSPLSSPFAQPVRLPRLEDDAISLNLDEDPGLPLFWEFNDGWADQEADADVEDELVVDHDSLYFSREDYALLDQSTTTAPPEALPPVFSEHRALRNAYVWAFVMGAYNGGTHASVSEHLHSVKAMLRDLNADMMPGKAVDLSDMALTLRTVEKRLGVDPDNYIVYLAQCSECWVCHEPKELAAVSSPQCSTPSCSGTLYTTKQTLTGDDKRVPVRILPECPIDYFIQRMLMRAGKWEELGLWKGVDDHAAALPMTKEEWEASRSRDAPLYSIHDGWRWRSLAAGMQRIWDADSEDWQDVDVKNLRRRFVSLPCGLVLMVNIDW
jgi:hypothetical protein